MKYIFFVILLPGEALAVSSMAWSASSAFNQSKVMVEGASLSDVQEMLLQWLGKYQEGQGGRFLFLLARVFTWQGKRYEALMEYRRLQDKEPANVDYIEGRARLPAKASQGAVIAR